MLLPKNKIIVCFHDFYMKIYTTNTTKKLKTTNTLKKHSETDTFFFEFEIEEV